MKESLKSDHRLVDYASLKLHRLRSRRLCPEAARFHQQAAQEFQTRLGELPQNLEKVAIVTGHAALWREFFPHASLYRDADVLDLPRKSADLVLHAMSLHWANDPVGQLIQCRLGLRPEGILMAACFGEQTLTELRTALALAEVEVSGGASPRVLPMADVRQYGDLLQRAGFGQAVADRTTYRHSYKTVLDLMHDLRAMGETNALQARRQGFTPRRLMAELETCYRSVGSSNDGNLLATFELVFLTGWTGASDSY